MGLTPFIRRELKSKWEGRTPLSPTVVRRLVSKGIEVRVERSERRVFEDEDYATAGARLVDNDADTDLVLGIKEPRIERLKESQVHLCFSHTIKGQDYNMPLLREFMAKGNTLIDYEIMKDKNGIRSIAFGRYAGIAGAIDTFHVAGRKWAAKGMDSVLARIEQTWKYANIETLRKAMAALDVTEGDFCPRIIITGTGNVGKGCVEVVEWMGLPRIEPRQVLDENPPAGPWYTVLGTQDLVASRDGACFDHLDYREAGLTKYRSDFDQYLGRFDILLQTPYWEEKYPSVLNLETMRRYADVLPPVIGDISCDIGGSIAATLKESSIDEPGFTYSVDQHSIRDGISWDGPTVMSIGHLPCELSEDASKHFPRILENYIPELVAIDLDKPFTECGLSAELQAATIVYKGELTPTYAYLQKFLDDVN